MAFLSYLLEDAVQSVLEGADAARPLHTRWHLVGPTSSHPARSMSGFHLLFPTKSSAEDLNRSSFDSGEVHRKGEVSLAPWPTEAISKPARCLEPKRKASEGFPYTSVVITDREGRRER